MSEVEEKRTEREERTRESKDGDRSSRHDDRDRSDKSSRRDDKDEPRSHRERHERSSRHDDDRERGSSSRRDDDRRSDRHSSSNKDKDKDERKETKDERKGDERKRERSPEKEKDKDKDNKEKEKEAPRKKKDRKTGWDLPPVLPPGGGLPLLPNMMMPMMPRLNMALQLNPNIERQRRRLYVGGLPANVNDYDIKQFFNEVIHAKVPNTAPGDPVTDTTLNAEKSFAFVELRTATEATKTLALDGVVWMQRALKLRRPNDYVPPIEGEASVEHIDGIVSTNVPDTPNKLFIGGLLPSLGEADVRELLSTIGELKSFNLVRDPQTNMSKGFAFAEFLDDATTERAIGALNAMPIGDKTLLVQRALIGARKDPEMPGQLSAENFPVLAPGELVTSETPAGIFLAPVPLPHLLAAIAGTGLAPLTAVGMPRALLGMSAAQTLGLVPAGGTTPVTSAAAAAGLLGSVSVGVDAARQAASKLAAAIHAKQTGIKVKSESSDVKTEKTANSDEPDAAAGATAAEEAKGDGGELKTESAVDGTTSKTAAEGGDSAAPVVEDEVPDDISLQHKARALPVFDPATSSHVSRILMLMNMVAPEQIVNDEEYFCLCADIKDEAARFGDVLDVKVPRRIEPEINEEAMPAPPGTGRVYIEYATEEMARAGCLGMGGRIFDGRSVIATFYSEEKWANGDLGPVPISAKFDTSEKKQGLLTAAPTSGKFLQ